MEENGLVYPQCHDTFSIEERMRLLALGLVRFNDFLDSKKPSVFTRMSNV